MFPRKKFVVVKKHLRDDVFRAGIDFAFEVLHINLGVGCFDVFFGVARHANREVGAVGVFEVAVEVNAFV